MNRNRYAALRPVLAVLIAAGAAAPCLTTPLRAEDKPAAPSKPEPAKAEAPKPAEAAKPTATPAAPTDPKPFDEVIKDAERIPGLFTFYRTPKNELWLEVTPELLNGTHMLQVTSTTGLGGRTGGATTGDPIYDVLFNLKKVREQVFLSVKQTNFRAKDGEPVARSVQRSFADSPMAVFRVGSQPHPERKSILVNCTSLFYTDLPGFLPGVQARLGVPFAIDLNRSYVDLVKSFPQNTEIEVAYGLAAPKAATADTLADGRAAALRLRYSFITLKDTGYQPRLYDARVGYFVNAFRDLTEDDPKDEYTRYILRWDLRKQDPNAALSAPVKPITFWLDNAIPTKYRGAVTKGVLSWNKAFEQAGFKDAVVVKQMPDGEEVDPFDIRYNMVRWATSPGDGYAVALFRTNPLTGEILNASIRVDASIVGLTRRAFRLEDELKGFNGTAPIPTGQSAYACEYGKLAVAEASFGMTALELMNVEKGDLPPSERERFIQQYITEILAHEMGHIVGLRHNFKGSLLYGVKDLNDTAKTSQTGLTSTVMDYTPANIAPPGVKQGDYYSTVVGPYDIWAVEYGYTPWPALRTPDAEKPQLTRIAAQSADPSHAYATDEDTVDMGFAGYGADPLSARFDMSADPLQFARERARMCRALYSKLEAKSPEFGESYNDTRRKFGMLLSQYLRSFPVAARYVGGLYTTRAHRGDPGAPLTPVRPVPAAKQREALDYIRYALFEANAFRFSPSLLNKLTPDKNWHWGIEPFDAPIVSSVNDQAQTMQRSILSWLFTPGLLSRLRDNEARVSNPAEAFTMAELFQGMSDSIFAEMQQPAGLATVPALRRDLQRDYLTILGNLYLGGNNAPADAQSLARMHLKRINSQVTAALNRSGIGMDVTTRAHLEQTQERIEKMLNAQVQRQG